MGEAMQTKNLAYTLGLDIGIASVGAALILPEEKRILNLHVRTFNKAETDKLGESLNKIRRDKRSARRRLRRRAHRLLRLARLMKNIGLITEASPSAFILSDRFHLTPWELRSKGLDERLAPKEWASVIYHIVKHRGFHSTRKSEAKSTEAKSDQDVGKMLSGVERNKDLLKEGKYRTVGKLAVYHEDFKERKRNKHKSYIRTFSRESLKDELKILFECQRNLGNEFAEPDFETKVLELLMARRPALSGDALIDMVGKCTFEKDENRIPKASYRAERFIWLGKLNNLKILGYGDARSLNESERRIIINLPFEQSKLTFKQVRKKLGLDTQNRFNLLSYRPDKKSKSKDKDPEESTFFEAKAFHTLRKAYENEGLESEWERDKTNADHLDHLAYALTCYKEDNESRKYLAGKDVESPIIEAVLEESFDKFIHLSQKALKKILPFMEAGQRYDEAVKSAKYNHSRPSTEVKRQTCLPLPDKNVIRNPVVYRALNQARKLVNAIVREYGPPAAVHIELARDLSRPFGERKRIEEEQKEYRKEKDKAKDDFHERFGSPPNGSDVTKQRFFRDQLDQCPYCQKALDIDRLFTQGYSEIDHILPLSRSFDNSLNNQVVVHSKCNQDKGNRTPYEYLDGVNDSAGWQSFVGWVQSNKLFRQAKRNRLLRENFDSRESEEFRERNLNDTRYICREFKDMMETQLQWHSDSKDTERCLVLSGQATAFLRHKWGLLKERENGDLHHALDAAVIGVASRGLVKRISDYSRRKELKMVRDNYIDPETREILNASKLSQIKEHFPAPWLHFREELLARLSPDPELKLGKIKGFDKTTITGVRPVRVSRAPKRRGTGAAHDDTIRSGPEDNKSVVKTPLTKLKRKGLKNIVGFGRDHALIDAIRSRLEEFDDNGKKAFGPEQEPLRKPSKNQEKAPIIRSVKLSRTQKSGLLVRHGIADNDTMLRADIFTKGNKFYAVPVYVANIVNKELPNKAVVQRKLEKDWPIMDDSCTFLFSLYPNDWVRLRLKKEEIREGYYSHLHRGTGNIDIWCHDRNRTIGKNGLLEGNGIKTALAIEKYHVDLLGNLYRVHSEERKAIYIKRKRS